MQKKQQLNLLLVKRLFIFILCFKKTKSTMEVLEDIDQAIKSISKYKRSSQQSKEKVSP